MVSTIKNTIKGFLEFVQAIWRNRFLIVQLTKRDFQSRYLGSYLGLPWAFIKPLAVIVVMWFAFTYGLKIGKVDNNVPFAMWLVIGIIPWFYVSDNIIGSTRSLQEYSFLIWRNPPYFFMTIVAVLDKESISLSKFS